MKRLIVLALAVACAIGAQAAAVNWQLSGSGVNNKTVYAFLNGDKAAITALLEADNTGDAFTSGLGSYAHGQATGANKVAAGYISDSSLAVGSNNDMFFVIYTGGSDPSYRISSVTQSATAYDPSDSSASGQYPAALTVNSTNFGSTVKFSSQAPEPTSGLLLAVGLGLLGLRRKRA